MGEGEVFGFAERRAVGGVKVSGVRERRTGRCRRGRRGKRLRGSWKGSSERYVALALGAQVVAKA